jgi:flagellin
MMHAFMDEILTNGMVGIVNGKLDESDSYPKWFKEGMAQTAAGAYYNNNDFVRNIGIPEHPTITEVENALNNYKLGGTDDKSVYGTGYLACMYLGYLAGGGGSISLSSFQTGFSNIFADLDKGDSLEDVINKYTGYTSISDFENDFANTASTFVYDLTNYVNANNNTGTGGMVGGLTKNDDILNDTAVIPLLNLFKLDTTSVFMLNTYPQGYDIRTGGSATNGKGRSGTGGTSGSGGIGGISISSLGSGHSRIGRLRLQVGADATSNNKITIFIDAMNAKTLGLLNVSVKTQDSSRYSIERVALALARVSEQRSELGSYQNRLEHTIKNLDNVVENTTASESQIRDTDMATELVKFYNTNILKQVGQSMLAQANQTNQGVLSLLS